MARLEYIAPTPRRSMTKARATRIFLAANGVCWLCGNQIRDGEKWDAEHVTALTLGGADDDANLKPAHVKCHAVKTVADRKADAKRNRIVSAGYAGKRKPRGFQSKFRKKMNGDVVLREECVRVSRDLDADAQRYVEK